MTEKIQSLLRKTFVEGDIKRDAMTVQETNLRHAVAANSVFDRPSKWLLESELENQCVDWVYRFLLSKEFPDSWAAKISKMTTERAFSDAAKMEKLKRSQGEDDKGISTEQLESHVADVLQSLARELHSRPDHPCESNADARCRPVREVSVFAIKNTRRKMEDRHIVLRHYSDMFGLQERYSFFAVFDGHGGVDAARFSSTHLPGILSRLLRAAATVLPAQRENGAPDKSDPATSSDKEDLQLFSPCLSGDCQKSFESLDHLRSQGLKVERNSYHESDPARSAPSGDSSTPFDIGAHTRKALEQSFLETDRIFCERAKVEKNGSGCTAVCLLVEESSGRFHVAWAGDSQVLLVRGGRAVEIMSPHKPEREDEKARILALGGSVLHIGTWRVNGALSVSRAIGDTGYKPFVSSDPDVASYDIHPGDEYLVLACDGLWDVVTMDDAVRIVWGHLEATGGDEKTAAQALVKEAKRRGSSDNITVVVVFLDESCPKVSLSQAAPASDRPHSGDDDNSGRGDGRKEEEGDGKENSEKPRVEVRPKEGGSIAPKAGKSPSHVSELYLEQEVKDSLDAGVLSQHDNKVEIRKIPRGREEEVMPEGEPGGRENQQPEKKEDPELGTNDDSKENFLASSAGSSSSEFPAQRLEFSPPRRLKAADERGSFGSIRSRVRRSPKISSSAESSEDKENVGLRRREARLAVEGASTSSSGSPRRSADNVDAPAGKREARESKTGGGGSLKKAKKSPDSGEEKKQEKEETSRTFAIIPPSGRKQQGRQPPAILHAPLPHPLPPCSSSSSSAVKAILQCPRQRPLPPFLLSSSSAVSIGYLGNQRARRKQSRASASRKFDLTPTSCKAPLQVGFGGRALALALGEHGQAGQRERWAVAIETGEDLERMFESKEEKEEEEEGTGGVGVRLNVSSTRW